MSDQEPTRIQRAAQSNIEEVQDRIDEIDERIDYQQCCDPNYSMSEEEKKLFEEIERLLVTRSQLEEVAERGLP